MQLQQLLNKDLDNMKYADFNERKIRMRVQISNGIKDGTHSTCLTYRGVENEIVL